MVLDAATPGKEAADRLVRNAKLLRDSCEAMLDYWGLKQKDLMEEIWKNDPEAKKRELDRQQKAKGRRTRN
jgi:hypothetical protein